MHYSRPSGWRPLLAQWEIIVNNDKSNIMKVTTDRLQTVSLTKGPTDEIEEFTYLGSVVSTRGGTEQNVDARMGKARTALRSMDKFSLTIKGSWMQLWG